MKESPGEDSFPIVCMHECEIEIELRMEAEKASKDIEEQLCQKWNVANYGTTTLPPTRGIPLGELSLFTFY